MTFNLLKRVRNGYRALVSQPIQIVRIVILFVCSIIVVLQVSRGKKSIARVLICPIHMLFQGNRVLYETRASAHHNALAL